MLVLGIDTSCYTTSIALVNNGELLSEKRILLKVKEGERGLQQSAALFQHVQNLPQLFKQLFSEYKDVNVQGICSSIKPRPVTGSYMPVFNASAGFGETLASALKIPFLETTHQEGHIMAGIWSAGGPIDKEFLAVHMSGGTTELLKVRSGTGSFELELLGGSKDLHAGQFIDRVGVALGFGFPAGPALEVIARESTCNTPISSAVKNYDISFSGPETAAMRMIEQNISKADVARAVEGCIATSVEKVIRRGIEEYQLKPVLIVGGVAANTYIRKRLKDRLEHRAVGARLFFAEPGLSTDNAVGVALLGEKLLKRRG